MALVLHSWFRKSVERYYFVLFILFDCQSVEPGTIGMLGCAHESTVLGVTACYLPLNSREPGEGPSSNGFLPMPPVPLCRDDLMDPARSGF